MSSEGSSGWPDNHVGDPYGSDIFTEADGKHETIANLGPLRALAGTWEGRGGTDVHPVLDGTEREGYVERYDLAPVDRQTNGPQLFYGLRYHTHIVKVGEVETFHDQVGYWLWEPATHLVTFSLSIPRGQALLAVGFAKPDATTFEVRATRGSTTYGIVSNPFLERAFRTQSFVMRVRVDDEDSWSYEQETILELPGVREPFAHTDRNTLLRLSAPAPNPLALGDVVGEASVG